MHTSYLLYLPHVVEMLISNGARTATKFVDRRTVVRAHRIVNGNKIDGRNKTLDIRVKIGTPNYHERKFIKDCMRVNMAFPVSGVRLAHFRK